MKVFYTVETGLLTTYVSPLPHVDPLCDTEANADVLDSICVILSLVTVRVAVHDRVYPRLARTWSGQTGHCVAQHDALRDVLLHQLAQ